ncbi:MAG: MOSC domain-containing protein [Cytophaga sp.]|uniref:MOSC domain-containing protein n=1 Tax=Cytophaga sp. TaxID=29535 RepID=UPI003F7D48AB
MQNHIHQINISKGGVPKLPVGGVYVTKSGLAGDKQKNKRYHGGPERAVCLFSMEIIEQLQHEGHPVYPGSTGENITVYYSGYTSLTVGDRLQLGQDVIIEITSYTVPCKTIIQSFADGYFSRISQKMYPGNSRLYAKVIREGWIQQADLIHKI